MRNILVHDYYKIKESQIRYVIEDDLVPLLEQVKKYLVQTGLHEYYESTGRRYVSTHPMFGPTFANLQQLSEENAIIISEGDYMGRIFFKDLYQRLDLNIYEYTFEEHDRTVAYSLSIPFVSTFVFAAVMKHQDAPGTTFKRHMRIAKGVLNEDDYLLQEVLFNPYTSDQVAERVIQTVDSIQTLHHDPLILVMGDFNDETDGDMMQLLSRHLVHVCVGAKGTHGAKATYRYRGHWGSLDHILVSAPLAPWVKDKYIEDHPFLIEDDNKYGGKQPKRTYVGPRYHQGASDHLPLVVVLKK